MVSVASAGSVGTGGKGGTCTALKLTADSYQERTGYSGAGGGGRWRMVPEVEVETVDFQLVLLLLRV